jgi:hypothetical protein
MAKLKLKQLGKVLSGSLQVSGSSGVTGSFSVISGNISGSATSTGSFGRIQITPTGNAEFSTNTTGKVVMQAVGHQEVSIKSHHNTDYGSELRFSHGSNDNWRLSSRAQTDSGPNGRLVFYDDDSYELLALTQDKQISGSAQSTGSFGTLQTAGDINASGRIFESGTSVIDHATAMAIVFGG